MSTYYEFVENYVGASENTDTKKYCNIGHTFCLDSEEIEGIYWFYESKNFIVHIHDFFVKKEYIQNNFPEMSKMSKYASFCSAYIISGNGETFNPYQNLSPNSLYVLDVDNLNKNYRFLLHENSIFLGVGINFKKEIIREYLSSIFEKKDIPYSDIFLKTRTIINKSLEPIAKDILNCKMTSPAAEIFFESKAKEWLSIVVNAFFNRKEVSISTDDNKALENVANYLDDHYTSKVSQKTLEKIATMSGTKLKKLFKEKYNSSITEYVQRKRMNMAENLLLNSTLKVQDIARAVGYSSHSKFTACFKKYKGVYPGEIKQYLSKKISDQ